MVHGSPDTDKSPPCIGYLLFLDKYQRCRIWFARFLLLLVAALENTIGTLLLNSQNYYINGRSINFNEYSLEDRSKQFGHRWTSWTTYWTFIYLLDVWGALCILTL